jgi:acyl-ACP thioesterase
MMTSRNATARATDRLAFETSYRVRFDEAGPDGHLRTSGFMRFAQDLAWLHSTSLGFGREWYAERGLTWLVRAADLEILADVPMGDILTARTEVVGMRRVFARRRGEFDLADGSPAGWVHTDWVLIDERGALTRIPSIFGEMFGGHDSSGRVGRIALPSTPAAATRRRFAVRPHELDPLDHVNNAVYLDWLEESVLAADEASGGAAVHALPRRYRMEFALAAEAGAEVEAVAWPVDGGWNHRLTTGDGAIDLFRGRLETGGARTDGGADLDNQEEDR